jgi:hypothetical protein
VGKPEGQMPLEIPRTSVDIIKIDLRRTECCDMN